LTSFPVILTEHRRRGFSLIEAALTLGVIGVALAGTFQLFKTSGDMREAALIGQQALSVSAAAQQYIMTNRTSLMALGGLSALNSVVKIKLTSADSGATSDSVQQAGLLPATFRNATSYGQSYALYVRREDAGTPAAADASDRLVGLLITTGGSEIPDTLGARIASVGGAPGGFFYADSNPASPTAATTALGSNGTWQIDMTAAGWSTIGATATAGHLAFLTNLTPGNVSGVFSTGGSGGGTPGATTIDELDDGKTDYSTLYNVFLGSGAGENTTVGGYSAAVGYQAMQNRVGDSSSLNDTAVGYRALLGNTSGGQGSANVAIGSNTLFNVYPSTSNTAVGSGAGLVMSPVSHTGRTLVGSTTGLFCSGNNVTFIGTQAGYCNNFATVPATGTVAVGYNTMRYNTNSGTYNTFVGTDAAAAAGTSTEAGDFNTAIGYYTFRSNTSAASDGNIFIGYMSGAMFTSGNTSITIGANTTVLAGSNTNRLNIGNFIYGSMGAGGILQLGSSSLPSGIGFSAGPRTDSIRMAMGTNAQRPTCNATLAGATRWNTTITSFEFCNGTQWMQLVLSTIGATTPGGSDGYFVMTAAEWDGNLGGLAGADAKCLSDLTTYNWKGKTDASARGLLVAGKVKAFLCTSSCNMATPSTTYHFARSGSTTIGGASFLTNASGQGPDDTAGNWAATNYFSTARGFWSNRPSVSSALWGDGDAAALTVGGDACAHFTSNNSSKYASQGIPTFTDSRRWAFGDAQGGFRQCNNTLPLVCFVHP